MSSKYFSPALNDVERESLAHVLGLTHWNFLMVESVRGEVLRATEVFNGKIRTVLDEATSLQTFHVDHSVTEASDTKRAGIRLWREIVPHPFFLLPHCKEMSRLWNAFCEFEEALMGCELSVLKVTSPLGQVHLLFHYVRSRCVRVGTTQWPREFGTSVQVFHIENNGIQSPSVLAEHFENAVKTAQPHGTFSPRAQSHSPVVLSS